MAKRSGAERQELCLGSKCVERVIVTWDECFMARRVGRLWVMGFDQRVVQRQVRCRSLEWRTPGRASRFLTGEAHDREQAAGGLRSPPPRTDALGAGVQRSMKRSPATFKTTGLFTRICIRIKIILAAGLVFVDCPACTTAATDDADAALQMGSPADCLAYFFF